MSPWKHIVWRLAGGLATVWVVASVCFALLHALPGDPADAILGETATAEDRAALRACLRLDRPLAAQYRAFMEDLVIPSHGLGHSCRDAHASAWDRIGDAWPSTIALALCAALVAWALAIPLALLAATRPGSRTDGVVGVVSMLGVAIPSLWLGPMAIVLLCVWLPVLPFPGPDATGPASLVLPSLTLGTGMAGILTRMGRGALLETLDEPYVSAARARGASEFRVLFAHALRNALVPLLTTGGAQLAGLLGGAIVTEKIFDRRGLGTVLLEAMSVRDVPIVLACVVVMAVTAVLVQLAVDVGYVLVDPRIRLG